VNQVGFSAKAFDKSKPNAADDHRLKPNMTVFDNEAIQNMKNMASIRAYKLNGVFNSRVLSTCPSHPRYHTSNGEPTISEPHNEEHAQKSVTERAIKLMGRIEFIELNEEKQEVYVKDDFGIYVMHDCSLQDLKSLEDELLKIGSYYLQRSEVLVDPTQKQSPPAKDRQELLSDLLKLESDFQFQKVKLCQVYLECYEHITSPLEQQKIMQTITDIMARRPRLNLQANYFVDAYTQEIECLKKQFELTKQLVDLQVTLEKTENERLQKALQLSYDLADKFAENRWAYADAEELLRAVMLKRKISGEEPMQSGRETGRSGARSKASQISKVSKAKTEVVQAQDSENNGSEKGQDLVKSLNDGLSSGSILTEADYGKDDENAFTQLLGLPKTTIETIYQSYKEKDLNVIKLMQEHSHFIAMHEGYPEFMTRTTHRSRTDKFKTFKVNKWSQDTGCLDFYETLDFINCFTSAMNAS
jgi:hypothetical protein